MYAGAMTIWTISGADAGGRLDAWLAARPEVGSRGRARDAVECGKVFLNGHSLYDLSPNQRAALRRQKVGFVFQTFNLVPYLTALENVQIPLFLAGRNGPAQVERAAAPRPRTPPKPISGTVTS